MSRLDLDINKDIRKVFVRHWIDLGRVAIHSSGGAVTVRGSLHLIPGVKTSLTSQTVQNVFAELRRVDNVKRMYIELENWVEVEGSWQPSAKEKAPVAPGETDSFTIRES